MEDIYFIIKFEHYQTEDSVGLKRSIPWSVLLGTKISAMLYAGAESFVYP
jgi:hypothetical protein